nr:hypothetical protein [Micromonospora sp. DSM 115978]
VVQRTPRQVAYRPVSEVLFALLLSVVPRAVWPGKPLRVEGYLFGQQYYDMPTSIYSADAILPQADLYRHGGLAVVVVGMVVLGAGCRVLDDQFHPATDPRLVVAYLPLLLTLVKSEAGAVQLVATIPLQVAVLVCLSRFAFGRPASVGSADRSALSLPSQQTSSQQAPSQQDPKSETVRHRPQLRETHDD